MMRSADLLIACGALLVALACLESCAVAEPAKRAEVARCTKIPCIDFPPDAGIINVRDHGALGDGKHDDTAAILAAMRADVGDGKRAFWLNHIVYFPEGTYLVSDTLSRRLADGRFASGMVLMGQSRGGSVLRLLDNAPGFDQAAKPKAVIFSSARLLDGTSTSGGKDYKNKGEGNDAYANYVENMTIDVGRGNPGAIGIDYLANNIGALRDVSVRAPAGSGAIGISMQRKWPGPSLLSNVTVEGFDTGIAVSSTEYSITFNHVTIDKPRATGLRNAGNSLAIDQMTIREAPLAIDNTRREGLIVADGLTLQGKGNGEAVRNVGHMTLSNSRVDGYATVFGRKDVVRLAGQYDGDAQPDEAAALWKLAPLQPPEVPADPPERWVSVGKFGADATGAQDSTEAIRKAFASGASTVYFPHGTYTITDSIVVPASVRRIVGMYSGMTVSPQQRKSSFDRKSGMFQVEEGRESLLIERLAFDMTNRGGQLSVEHQGERSLTLRDIVTAGTSLVHRTEGGGPLFVEDVCCGVLAAVGPAPVQAWQVNSEGNGTRIFNRGVPMRIVGLKTEGNVTALSNDGGDTAVIGGLVYIVHPPSKPVPAFVNRGGNLFVAYAESAYLPNSTYRVHIHQESSAGDADTRDDSLPKRGMARMVPGLAVHD